MSDDPYAALAELYDFSYGDFDDDVDLYTNLGNAVDGPVLELGVGTGRVAIPLAQRGFEMVGIDRSESMLSRAAKNLAGAEIVGGGSLKLAPADMTAFDLERQFGMVLVAANTFQHLLTTEDQSACLACVVNHLRPGGIFAFSVRSPSSVSWDDSEGDSPLQLDWTRSDPATGEMVMKMTAGQAEPARQVKRWTHLYDRIGAGGQMRRSVFVTELRYSSQAELTLLLQQAGLRVTHVYGNYDLSPVGDGDNLVFVARAEGRL